MLLVVHLSFLHVKQLLTKRSFRNRQTYANRLSGLMLANYTPIPLVKRKPPAFIRIGTLIQKPVESPPVETIS